MKYLQNSAKIFALAPPTNQIWRRKHESLSGNSLKIRYPFYASPNVTNHQILKRISTVTTNRQKCQHIVAHLEFVCDKKFNMATAIPQVVSNLEINGKAEKFRKLSPI
jgi:hypothetical protein